jgi:CheY-like chemotaxis protein/glycine cleavage system H lipoate-binding protein
MGELRDVLIVEDELVVREAARRILGPEGLSTDLVTDVASALEMMEQATYKMILSDLKLPGPPGFELIAPAKAADRATQVVMVTGYATLANAVEAFQLGSFDFVPKPFDVHELLGVVRRALRFRERLIRETAADTPDPEDGVHDGAEERLFLGAHAWVLPQEDGSATCGVADSFRDTVDDLNVIEMPEVEERVVQGERMVRLIARDQLVHRVRAPLGGRVIATNERLRDDADLMNRDPYRAGWLVRIIPENPGEELKVLKRRSPG